MTSTNIVFEFVIHSYDDSMTKIYPILFVVIHFLYEKLFPQFLKVNILR